MQRKLPKLEGVEKVLADFLHHHLPDQPPLLLALSGGPDSMALFHLLLALHYPFEVAHVDHRWRVESEEESRSLNRLCHRMGIAFHLERLTPNVHQKNLEEQGRVARLAFFKTLIEHRNLQGVLLAHQADDQAETVLKRLFEGASLPKLKGLLPKTEIGGITLYRPLLKIKKSTLLLWLEERKIPYFSDPTNFDPRFLRSRLRGELIPTLSSSFGKEIGSNLCRLGEGAAELALFLESLTAPYLEKVEKGEGRVSLDFTSFPPTPYLWKWVIRSLFDQNQLALSNSLSETILSNLLKGSCHKNLKIGPKEVWIHKKTLMIHLCKMTSKDMG